MDRDRTEICKIVSEMLDNPDKHGIYPTSTAYTKLELYIESERIKAVGWMYSKACTELDKGNDLRLQTVPDILSEAGKDLV